MSRRVGRLVLWMCMGGPALPRLAVAQGSSAVSTARATVVTANIVVNGLSDLAFGTVLGGVATTVLPTGANAGSLLVTGNPNGFITMTFTLPAVLTNTTGPPGTMFPSGSDQRRLDGGDSRTTLPPAIRSICRSPRPAAWVRCHGRSRTYGSVGL